MSKHIRTNTIPWMYSKEALQNLEYLADQSVIEKHPNSMEYQKAIVQFSLPSSINNLRSEFSKSNLKNRIMMMNKPKIKKSSKAKILLLFIMMLLFIAAMLMSFSIKVTNNGNQSYRSETKKTISSRTINGKVIKSENGEAISGAIVTIVGSANKGSVTDQKGKFTITIDNEEELIVSMRDMASQIVDIRNTDDVVVRLKAPGAENLDKVEVVGYATSDKSQIKFNDKSGQERKPLIMVGDEEISHEEMSKMNHNNINNIQVFKESSAIKLYGDKAKDGVIIIELDDINYNQRYMNEAFA